MSRQAWARTARVVGTIASREHNKFSGCGSEGSAAGDSDLGALGVELLNEKIVEWVGKEREIQTYSWE